MHHSFDVEFIVFSLYQLISYIQKVISRSWFSQFVKLLALCVLAVLLRCLVYYTGM